MITPEQRVIDIPFKVYKGCYLLYNEDELVYVGVSNNIAVRLWQHHYKSAKQWTSVKFIEELDYIEAIKIENYLIEKYRPKYNSRWGKLQWHMHVHKNNLDSLKKLKPPSGW